MAVAYRCSATESSGSTGGNATLSITIPTSGSGGTTVAGDVGIACLECAGTATVSTTPTGWTQRLKTTNAQGNITGMIYTKTLVSGDINAASAWITSSGLINTGSIDVFSGADESSFTFSTLAVGTGTTVTSPTITIPANGFIYGFWMGGITSAGAAFTFTKNGTYTLASTVATSITSGLNHTQGTAFLSVPAGGSTAGVGCTFSVSTARNAAASVAIAPSTVAASVTASGPMTGNGDALTGTTTAAATETANPYTASVSALTGTASAAATITATPFLATAAALTGNATASANATALIVGNAAALTGTASAATGVTASGAMLATATSLTGIGSFGQTVTATGALIASADFLIGTAAAGVGATALLTGSAALPAGNATAAALTSATPLLGSATMPTGIAAAGANVQLGLCTGNAAMLSGTATANRAAFASAVPISASVVLLLGNATAAATENAFPFAAIAEMLMGSTENPMPLPMTVGKAQVRWVVADAETRWAIGKVRLRWGTNNAHESEN